MKITFELLKKISDGGDEYLLEVLNSFDGDNIHEKFINILKCWDRDVSYDISLNLEGNNIKVMLTHIIAEATNIDTEDVIVGDENLKFHVNFPKTFDSSHNNIFSYGIINTMKYCNTEMCYTDEYNKIIDNLPAKYYNDILSVVEHNDKILKFSNQSLKNLKINFLTYEPYKFLKSLFTPFGADYFRDIIYHLSKKIDGNMLLQSTIFDIEYYIDKLNLENKESDVPNLG